MENETVAAPNIPQQSRYVRLTHRALVCMSAEVTNNIMAESEQCKWKYFVSPSTYPFVIHLILLLCLKKLLQKLKYFNPGR